MNAGEREFSRLADELQFVRLYLELQQRRFADRLTINLPRVEDNADLWVPSLILQPLVENAVVHGLAGHQGLVVVRVAIHKANEVLILRVTNTIAPDTPLGADGIGLTNVRERLAVQFGRRAQLTAGPPVRNGPARSRCPSFMTPPAPQRRPKRRRDIGRGMMNVIIVDDEQAGRRSLREFCAAESDLCVIGEYSDGATALEAIRAQRPHLLFLDIQMNPPNGLEVARALAPEPLPSLVFVTAYDSYALQAFELSAVDYLLKPFDQDRFRKTLARDASAPRERRCR